MRRGNCIFCIFFFKNSFGLKSLRGIMRIRNFVDWNGEVKIIEVNCCGEEMVFFVRLKGFSGFKNHNWNFGIKTYLLRD